MQEYAQIKGYRETKDGTELMVFVPKNLTEYLKRYQKGGKIDSELRLDDPRYISSKQRRAIYATINDISEWYGDVPEYMKEILKAYYITEQGKKYFSLSNCSVTQAREFIDYLLEFALKHDIALAESGLERTDNIDRYLYMCLKHKKCCICGVKGEIHHTDAIGMGNDRRKVDDSEHRKICLCRKHHIEAHAIGVDSFNGKHKVKGIRYTGDEE